MSTDRSWPMREAIIDTAAITHNVRHFRRLTGVEVIPVVKADGYGHGAATATVAAIAGGAQRVAVADIDEALALRRAGIDVPIIAWLLGAAADLSQAAAAGVEIGVSRLDQLAAAAAASHPVAVHLKLETGLGRNGLAPAEWSAAVTEAARLERQGAIRVVGVFSHLSNTSDTADRAALTAFESGLRLAHSAGLRPAIRHLAATQAAIWMPRARFDAVRIGIGVYGLSPTPDRSSAELDLRPAMSLRAQVIAVRRVPAGQGVSYGYEFRAQRQTSLALIPLGYADGVPRQASGVGQVSIGGHRATVAGRIAMDQFVVDVGDNPVRVGDQAVLFGDPATGVPSADEWAAAAGTINYDIVTGIGPRVPRRTQT